MGIHGCIDGYSRHILWLEVSRSNKDPIIVGKYFIDCIHQLNGAPRAIRADRGVENTIIAGIQRYFHNFENSLFLFGKSTSNQRIEAGCSFFRRRFLQIWMNLFKDMRDEGLYNDSNVFHVECLVFCFYGIIQDKLTKTMTEWNTHRIHCVHNSETPAGRPDVLFFTSNVANRYITRVSLEKKEVAKMLRKDPLIFGCSNEFAESVMKNSGLQMPIDKNGAEELYIRLISLIDEI